MESIVHGLRLLTGGRPMTRLCHVFTDCVSGEPVYYCVDLLGRFWLATGRWSLFRVQPSGEPTDYVRPEPRP